MVKQSNKKLTKFEINHSNFSKCQKKQKKSDTENRRKDGRPLTKISNTPNPQDMPNKQP